MFLSFPTLKKITNIEKKKAHDKASRLPYTVPPPNPSATIIPIPETAINMAMIVLLEIFSLRNIHASIDVIRGQELRVNRAFATVVCVIAKMIVGFARPKHKPA